MNDFNWNWKISDIKQDKDVTVFSTFSCGGGSSLGYKRAGFNVIGNVEIDPKINDLYITNNKPKFNYCQDLRAFNLREDLPEELYRLDILDGSPPCTSFSTVGIREKGWNKAKRFREGQAYQRLDDLFFVFLDTVEKLRPRVVIAENVVGITRGKAKGYVKIVIDRFKELGYNVQVFQLNAAYMDVPQARHRVFFVANRCGRPELKLDFCQEPIRFGSVRTERGVEPGGTFGTLLNCATENDRSLADVAKRLTGDGNKYFSSMIVSDNQVAPCVTSAGAYYRLADKSLFSAGDFINVQTFPQDYNFKKQNIQYVCGMSVPPNMMANVALEVWKQWLS